jgi:hypothetical protein
MQRLCSRIGVGVGAGCWMYGAKPFMREPKHNFDDCGAV